MIAAANRDRRVFAEPQRLVFDRTGPSHVAFGHGIHRCLGAPLGSAEAQIAIGTMLVRLPDLRLDGAITDLSWKSSDFLRGSGSPPDSKSRVCRLGWASVGGVPSRWINDHR
ncbi:hypothetical protein AB0F17_63905 [Nonomuraea sp. NPDC026600]|uniref:hypothetical protein n=1 Tax=Nonomuraea sp. NPDC026600 TaxID=3155363 RepID=UPI0033EE6CFF